MDDEQIKAIIDAVDDVTEEINHYSKFVKVNTITPTLTEIVIDEDADDVDEEAVYNVAYLYAQTVVALKKVSDEKGFYYSEGEYSNGCEKILHLIQDAYAHLEAGMYNTDRTWTSVRCTLYIVSAEPGEECEILSACSLTSMEDGKIHAKVLHSE